MHRIRRLLLSTAVCLTAACGNDAPTETTPASAVSQDNGKPTYMVVAQAYHPPFSIRNSDGSITGLDIELLRAIGEAEGFHIDVLPHDLNGILDTLQQGTADIVTSIQITPENQKNYLFSQPYLESGYGALVPAAKKIGTFAELQGKTVSVATGGSVEKQLRSINLTDKILPVKTLYLALKEVKQDNASAVYSTGIALQAYLKQNPDYVFLADEKSGPIQFGFALEKQNTTLQNKINSGLQTIRSNGTHQKIVNHWMNMSPTADGMTASAATP